MNFVNEKIAILYGSQTGNAQDVAERIWRESKTYYFESACCCMDDYDIINLIKEKCVIFVCSTTGQGEEPDNMKNFWKFLLRKSLPANSLQNLNFAVLGLGDSSYAKFNYAAKRLNKRLLQLGGQMLSELGLGDDQHDLGYDAVVDPWIDVLWKNLLHIYPIPIDIQPLEMSSLIRPRWNVNVVPSFTKEKSGSIYYSTKFSNEFNVTVKENIRVTAPSHFQDVRLIKFNTPGVCYVPGDCLVLRPKNLPSQVELFQQVLSSNGINLSSEMLIKITESDVKMPVPAVLKYEVTFEQLCEEYFDLTAVPRRYVFSVLAQLTDNELEKDKLLEFTKAEGQEDLYNYVNRPRRNIVEVLQDFPHATKNLTLDVMFEILTPIKPREFSIASSCKSHIDEVHLLVAVVKYKTKLVKERLGLCSNYLAELKTGDEISVWIKKGCFAFPKYEKDIHIIMVGPGTGLAPFRNYIFDCVSSPIANLNKLVLFFGCRNKSLDFYCGEEFQRLAQENNLNFFTAFSRDQDYKIYVQHKIEENGALIWDALQKSNTYVFVAGNSKFMPQQVKEAFQNVLQTQGKMSEGEARNFLEKMEKDERYQTECWS